MKHSTGGVTEPSPLELGPDAADVLRMILDHELRSRPRVRCLIATCSDAAETPRPADGDAKLAPGARRN